MPSGLPRAPAQASPNSTSSSTPDASSMSSELNPPLSPDIEKQNGDDYSRCFEDTLEMGFAIDRSQSNPEALSVSITIIFHYFTIKFFYIMWIIYILSINLQ